jgi:hypothetical protein
MTENSGAQLISIAVERDLQLETLKLGREFFYRDFFPASLMPFSPSAWLTKV